MNSEFTPGGVRLDYAQRMGGFGKLWHRSGAGRAASFIGGAISRAAAAGLVTGACLIVAGMSPGQLIDYLWTYPPAWLLNGWTRLLLLILGLAVISLSLRFNVWSQQQKAIDALAEDMSRAFHDLVNRPMPADKTERALFLSEFDRDYKKWCDQVNQRLENRAFFTRADQLHFERLGFVPPVHMTGDDKIDHLMAQLKLKFERLREIIESVQQRKR